MFNMDEEIYINIGWKWHMKQEFKPNCIWMFNVGGGGGITNFLHTLPKLLRLTLNHKHSQRGTCCTNIKIVHPYLSSTSEQYIYGAQHTFHITHHIQQPEENPVLQWSQLCLVEFLWKGQSLLTEKSFHIMRHIQQPEENPVLQWSQLCLVEFLWKGQSLLTEQSFRISGGIHSDRYNCIYTNTCTF